MWYVILFIASLAISYFLAPRPQFAGSTPATLDDFNFPTAEDGREISWLFGTRDITAPDTEWYGDLRVIAVTSSAGGKK